MAFKLHAHAYIMVSSYYSSYQKDVAKKLERQTVNVNEARHTLF